MMNSSADGNSSDDSAAHASDMSGGSNLESTFKAQEATLITRPEDPDFVCPNSQWLYLQYQSPRTSDLGVSDMGGDSDNDDDNSNSGHSVTGRAGRSASDLQILL